MKKFSKQSDLVQQFAAQLNNGNVVVVERIPGTTAGTMDVVLMQKMPLEGISKGIDYLYGKAAGAYKRMIAWGLAATHPLVTAPVGSTLPADLKLDYSYYSTESKRARIDGKLRSNALASRMADGKPLAIAATATGEPVYRDTVLTSLGYVANKSLVAGEISLEQFAQKCAESSTNEVVGNREVLTNA